MYRAPALSLLRKGLDGNYGGFIIKEGLFLVAIKEDLAKLHHKYIEIEEN